MLTLCKEIVVFLIVAKMLESFQIGKKYGKFVKLIISLIVVLKLITPIFSIFNADFDMGKMAMEMEEKLVFNEESLLETANEESVIEPVEIQQTKIEVEEIRWEK